jgi:cytochrome c oxidase subunit 2
MTAMALLLMLALWLIALATALLFSLRWLPPLAALNSGGMDTQIKLSFAVLGVLFLGTQAALAWFVFRFRQSRQSIPPQRQAVRDALWMTLAAGIFFMLTVLGAQVWAQTSYLGVAPDADAVRVEVTAEQFRWYFRYPGADGKFGATNIRLQDASEGNPLGLDPADAAGIDDRVSAALVVPAGRPVEMTLRSHDVIHSFYVPALRFKQDAVPGMDIRIHFTATEPGTYDIVCAELCGLGHHSMNAKLRVLSAQEFAAWLREGAGR